MDIYLHTHYTQLILMIKKVVKKSLLQLEPTILCEQLNSASDETEKLSCFGFQLIALSNNTNFTLWHVLWGGVYKFTRADYRRDSPCHSRYLLIQSPCICYMFIQPPCICSPSRRCAWPRAAPPPPSPPSPRSPRPQCGSWPYIIYIISTLFSKRKLQ